MLHLRSLTLRCPDLADSGVCFQGVAVHALTALECLVLGGFADYELHGLPRSVHRLSLHFGHKWAADQGPSPPIY